MANVQTENLLDPTAATPGSANEGDPLQRVVKYAERLIFERPLWHLIAALFLLDLVKNGMWTAVEINDWAGVAKTFPGTPSVEHGYEFILSSPIGPSIAHYLAATTSGRYAAFSLLVTGIAVAILVRALKRCGGRLAAGVGLVALFASPLSNTLLTWLGKEDPFLLLFTALAILSSRPGVVLISGLGLAASNPEAGAVILATCIAIRLSESRSDLIRAFTLVIGFVLGCGVVVAYDAHIHASFAGRVAFVKQMGVRTLIRQFISELPTWVFTIFGAYWISIIHLWKRIVTGKRRFVVAGSAALCVMVTAGSVDQTRIFALVSLPLLFWFVTRSARVVQAELLRRVTTYTFLVAILLPRVVVQAGNVYVSHLGNIIP